MQITFWVLKNEGVVKRILPNKNKSQINKDYSFTTSSFRPKYPNKNRRFSITVSSNFHFDSRFFVLRLMMNVCCILYT